MSTGTVATKYGQQEDEEAPIQFRLEATYEIIIVRPCDSSKTL